MYEYFQVEKLKQWLSNDTFRKNVPFDTLFIVVNEIDNHVVAIKGNGIFSITYSVVANVRSSNIISFMR